MIINGLTMKDFQCYSGGHADNKFIFSRGINLIIGNNGHGKSKLFDAFYWVIYDQIFSSDDRIFKPTMVCKEALISDKAKALCKDGEKASAEVVLHVTDSQSQTYRITRMFRAQKKSNRQWVSEPKSTLLIEQIKKGTPQLVSPDKHDNVLNRVIPGHLKPYMWFQGEQVDSLMDFKSKSALMQTVNLLSDIEGYDRLIEIASVGSNRAIKALSKARKDNSKNQQESSRLGREESKHRDEIVRLKGMVADHQGAVDMAIEATEGLVGQVADAERRVKLKQEGETAASEQKVAENEVEARVTSLNGKLFSDFWLLRNVEPFSDNFAAKYKQYFRGHQEVISSLEPAKLRLPVDMPQPIHVQEMLDAEECFVCGREAKKGSAEHEHIQQHLRRDKVDVAQAFKNDCADFYERLYNNSLGFRHVVKRLEKRIPDEFGEISSLRSKAAEAQKRVSEVKAQFEELLSSDRSENIVSEFKTHESNRSRYSNLLKQAEYDLAKEEELLEGVLQQQQKLVTGKVSASIELGEQVWSSLLALSESTRGRVFQKLVTDLEGSANRIFNEMTCKNKSITGRLQLRTLGNERIVAEIVDKDGHTLSGSNDSNIILVKLALIMAILKSRALWSQNYCMVTDAPTSKMAAEYSQGFYEALGDNFTQAIVMTYDFLDAEDDVKIKSLKVSKAYRLESEYPNGDRQDRADLSIAISEIAL